MEVNLKKFQSEKERATQIQQNNQILLCKMLSIDSGCGEHSGRAAQTNKPMKPTSLNSVKRQADQRSINVQNQRLLGKIVNAKSCLPTAVSVSSQERQRRQLLARMAKPKKMLALPKPPRTDLKYNMTVVTDVEKTLDRMERQLDRFSKQKKLQALKDAKRAQKHQAKADALNAEAAVAEGNNASEQLIGEVVRKASLPVVTEEA